MAYPISFALVAATISLATSTARSDGPGFLSMTLTRGNESRAIAKRDTPGTLIYNPDFGVDYFVEIFVGTPPQPVTLLLDTGSSETWVNPQCSTARSSQYIAECQSLPVYNPRTSSTVRDTLQQMYLQYGIGWTYGEYLIDDFMVAGSKVTSMQFGYGLYSNSITAGIIAVGFGVELVGYNCLIDTMKVDGIIASRAFSVDLGGVESSTGTLVFGGIDTKKYTGALEKLQIIPAASAPDGYTRYWVNMNYVGITKPGATTSKTISTNTQAVILDTGSTLSTLPQTVVDSLIYTFTGVVDQGGGLYTIDCNQTSLQGTIDFGFGNSIIHVPYEQFIWVADPRTCVFGAVGADSSSNDLWILGDTFLRAAYTVYDQDNKNIFVAQYVDCGSNIVPISSGVDAVPSLTGDCGSSAASTSTSPVATSASSFKVSSATSFSATSSSKTSPKSSTFQYSSSTPISKSSTKATSLSSSTSSSKLASSTSALVCKADNCLNQAKSTLSSAAAFCATYTTTSNINSAAIPTFLKNCASNTSRVSSACSCIASSHPTSSSGVVPTSTSRSAKATSSSAAVQHQQAMQTFSTTRKSAISMMSVSSMSVHSISISAPSPVPKIRKKIAFKGPKTTIISTYVSRRRQIITTIIR